MILEMSNLSLYSPLHFQQSLLAQSVEKGVDDDQNNHDNGYRDDDFDSRLQS